MFSKKRSINRNIFTRGLIRVQPPLSGTGLIENNQIKNNIKINEIKKEKEKIPGANLLKQIHKNKKSIIINSDSDDDNDDIERYAKSIKKVIKLFT
jgi:hypothetical protein